MMRTETCRDEDKPGSFELMAIYIQPAFKCSGIGSKLIKHIEEKTENLGIKGTLYLVFKETHTAKNFYGHHGFKPDSEPQTHEELKAIMLRYMKTI